MKDKLTLEIVDLFMMITRKIGGGEPLVQEDFQGLAAKLKDFAGISSGEADIPKALAEVFLDAYPLLEAYANRYGEVDSVSMRLASDEIGEIIREILIG
ncbi:hypothetical protein LAJ19_20245 (plasmid) [Deinococcus taeanensis]|uniref:hypothetical protein n=1 Tax=Deinococcus taeanensis TaxID=2737050 RepID=UPI001CDCE108|nr:hypothetical protein [Deinococcus taeanensis]UBV45459.1 hypothetical protein LAJ19_20245 [Deinococcus taeanensis]